MPDPRAHAENRNWVETILRYVPGFRGYLEKEYRRDSDKLQRDWLADRLQQSKRAIDDLSRPLADAGQIDLLPQVDRLRGRLDKMIGQIRGAVRGYSGFFDLVRVDEALLDRVYEHDAALVQQVDGLATAVEDLAQRRQDIPTRLGELLRQAEDLQRRWDDRQDILKGMD